MRLYHLSRQQDVSGTSATGHVAQVAEFDDGAVVVRWVAEMNAAGVASTTVFNSLRDLLVVHGREGKTGVELVVDTDRNRELEAAAQRLREGLREAVHIMNRHGLAPTARIAAALEG